MDNELREAVARAICDSTEADIFDDLAEQSIYRAVYLQQADAAIATVMEAPKILSILAQAADAGRYREGLDIIKDAVTQHEDGEFYPGEPASVLAFISGTAIGHLEALQGEA